MPYRLGDPPIFVANRLVVQYSLFSFLLFVLYERQDSNLYLLGPKPSELAIVQLSDIFLFTFFTRNKKARLVQTSRAFRAEVYSFRHTNSRLYIFDSYNQNCHLHFRDCSETSADIAFQNPLSIYAKTFSSLNFQFYFLNSIFIAIQNPKHFFVSGSRLIKEKNYIVFFKPLRTALYMPSNRFVLCPNALF